ncbi:MAG: TlyA family rRNA (cytidine-2'-O)-methyltransferase [Planctomycetes bacterium]|nr:TlyA family rRNA (cytidine-2'-O)-methyltransferase [Planctomycetota bacterium]
MGPATGRGGYASRGGLKLEAALGAFALDVRGLVCADLGSHQGGFVDCLLAHGASRVYAVEAGHGVLDWRLRQDPRVVVRERTNALACVLAEPVDLVSVDLGWTRLALAVPAAARLARSGAPLVALLKPHYEARPEERLRGTVRPEALEGVVARVEAQLAGLGLPVLARVESPLRGGKGGNREFLLLLRAGGGQARVSPSWPWARARA